MNKDIVTTIYGPPGTGKTTYLIDLVDQLLSKGTPPHKIAFLSFTRKAAHEARDRACAKFNLTYDNFTWFRTIHSLCFKVVSNTDKQLMGYEQYKDFGQQIGMAFSYIGSVSTEEGVPMLQTKGDKYLHFYNYSRATQLPLKAVIKKFHEEIIDEMELTYFIQSYENYKRSKDYCDFTDLLITYADSNHLLDLDYLIIDEAQDLSILQWKVINRISRACKRIYIAGDDDQAIYKWSGAEVDYIINLNTNKIVLDQSYRVPSEVHKLAGKISGQIKTRVPKAYKPREEKGSVNYVESLEYLDLSKGSWLLLARNNCYLSEYLKLCSEKGYFFSTSSALMEDKLPTAKELNAIVSWTKLMKGKPIDSADFKAVVESIKVKDGVIKYGYKKKILDLPDGMEITIDLAINKYGIMKTDPWYRSLGNINEEKRSFIVSCLKKGEKLSSKPRIKISSIHGVKGGEADNVVLMTDMTLKTAVEANKDMDSEHRVWYVGVTRTKQNLYIISPKTRHFYEIGSQSAH